MLQCFSFPDLLHGTEENRQRFRQASVSLVFGVVDVFDCRVHDKTAETLKESFEFFALSEFLIHSIKHLHL